MYNFCSLCFSLVKRFWRSTHGCGNLLLQKTFWMNLQKNVWVGGMKITCFVICHINFFNEVTSKSLIAAGYCGADIRAVCTEAALCALRRRYPQIYGTSQKLLLDVSSISVSSCDFVAAMRKMKPASQRSNACPTKPLSAVVQPLLHSALSHILEVLQKMFPHAEQGMKRKREPGEWVLNAGSICVGLLCRIKFRIFTSVSLCKIWLLVSSMMV